MLSDESPERSRRVLTRENLNNLWEFFAKTPSVKKGVVMAVLFTSAQKDPVEAFFYATPPRKVVCCDGSVVAIAALLGSQCNHGYALVPDSIEVPEGLEIRTRRPGFVLLQKRGQRTRSDRRSVMRMMKMATGERPNPPYFSAY